MTLISHISCKCWIWLLKVIFGRWCHYAQWMSLVTFMTQCSHICESIMSHFWSVASHFRDYFNHYKTTSSHVLLHNYELWTIIQIIDIDILSDYM